MRIILLGPPGAGKGTQGELLAKKFNLPRLSVGAVLRGAFKKLTPEGTEAAQYMEKGLNVPAKLLFRVLEPWFEENRAGFIVDNLPRSKEQLDEFMKFVKENDINIDKVFHLRVSEEEAVRRLLKRAMKRRTKGQARIDEDEVVIQQRYQVGYIKDIEPILSFFRKQRVLEEIDGEKTIKRVHQDILAEIRLKKS